MKKELKDYLHLYMGCKINTSINGTVMDGTWYDRIMNDTCDAHLILRPLSDIKIKEVFKCEEVMWDGFHPAFTGNKKDEFLKAFLSNEVDYRLTFGTYIKAANWLRKHSFDCDGLVEAGLAIDSTNLTLLP